MGQILVAVETDAGITGYGVGGGGLAGVHVVRTVLRELLLGHDPANIEELWRAMHQATLPFGRKGLAIMALSGVDLALWDLRGKVEGKPVARLLGGDVGRPIPAYVTVWGEIPPALATQFRAFKLHVDRESSCQAAGVVPQVRDLPHMVLDLVKKARDVIGPDCMLMLDAWMQWDLATTMTVAEKVAPYDIAWVEEPLPVDDVKGYAELVRCCPIPIAGGEHEFTAMGFAELIERRLHHILQPDACWCGGMTELIKIYGMAKDAGLRVCPHRGAEAWGLHAIAALDPEPLAETGRPWLTWVGRQPAIDNGTVRLADEPGFGVLLDDTRLGGK